MKSATLLLAAALALSACQSFVLSGRQILEPQFAVANVSPSQLEGRWYQIASFPASWEKNCFGATATYTPQPDGTLKVVNACRDLETPNITYSVQGVATPLPNGRIRVDLQGVPIEGAIWVLDVAPDGRSITLGTPWRNGGWVLSRDNRFDPVVIARAGEAFERSGYDLAALQRTRLAP